MKKWIEIKEQVELMSAWECSNYELAVILKDLVEWLDDRFYGEQAVATIKYLDGKTQRLHDLYSEIPEEEE